MNYELIVDTITTHLSRHLRRIDVLPWKKRIDFISYKTMIYFKVWSLSFNIWKQCNQAVPTPVLLPIRNTLLSQTVSPPSPSPAPLSWLWTSAAASSQSVSALKKWENKFRTIRRISLFFLRELRGKNKFPYWDYHLVFAIEPELAKGLKRQALLQQRRRRPFSWR